MTVSPKRTEVRFDAKRGVWYAQPYLGENAADGRQIRPRRSFPDARSKEEAQAMADAWMRNMTADGKVRSAMLGDMLAEYISDREIRDIKPNTAKSWRSMLHSCVGPILGKKLSAELDVYDMAEFERKLLAPKNHDGRGLSKSYVRNVHTFLSAAYRHWVAMGIVVSNPMDSLNPPVPEKHEAVALSEAEYRILAPELLRRMDAADDTKKAEERAACALAAWLSLHTGARRGEVCALRRMDVSRAMGCVRVRGNVAAVRGCMVRSESTKTRKSRNVSVTDAELGVVEEYLRGQDARIPGLSAESPLVTVDGGFMRPDTVSRRFKEMRDELGISKKVTFHSLRHTHATWLIASGMDVKTVSERLGHSKESITLNIYAHAMPGRDRAAAEAFEAFARDAEGGAGDV